MQQDHAETLKLKHNFKYDLISIKKSIEASNYHQAIDIINEKLDITSVSNNFLCNIPIIDAIINYKIHEIKGTGIKLTTQVSIYDTLDIDNTHLANLLGNLLDNAIYACKNNYNEKVIEVSMRQVQNNLYISVINSCEQNVSFKNGLPLSNKRGGTIHGIGYKTIQTTVDLYNGMLDIEVCDNKFLADIVLFNCMK